MLKVATFYSKYNSRALDYYTQLKKIIQFYPLNKADVLIVMGGDGFLLRSLQKILSYDIPIYGINLGTVGYILNGYKPPEEIINSINCASSVTIRPLCAEGYTVHNKYFKVYSFNEITCVREKAVAAKIMVNCNYIKFNEMVIGDGLIIATPLGSTGYNKFAKGNVLHINDKKIVMTFINHMQPLESQSINLLDQASIKVVNSYAKERPTYLSYDINIIKRIAKFEVSITSDYVKYLLYDKQHHILNLSN